MTPEDNISEVREVVVTSDPTIHGALIGHFGEFRFPVGGPDGTGQESPGPNPYDLLGASLAACTAMTVRFQAQRQKISLERMDVRVTFRRGPDGERDWFERTVVVEGNLDSQQRAFLLDAANLCPVGKILGIGADIRTRTEIARPDCKQGNQASYENDLEELRIPYIDAD